MQRMDLLGSAKERAIGIATAIVEVNHVIERSGLPVAEVWGRLRDLAKSLRPPKTGRYGLLAEIPVARGRRIIAEWSVHAEVGAGDSGSADKRLIGCASSLGCVGV